jgi:PAS domain S-box-containing protein
MVKVLIVEDRPEDTELMVRELRQSSLPLDWRAAASEREYRQSLDWTPDVILSDFNLPQFNAFDALRILDERMLDIPLIVVTGSISEEVAVDCIKLGAVDYLLKDRMARLPAAVASALDEKRLRDEKRRTEEQLKDREERLRLALESARMATWDWNLTTGEVRFSDEAGPLFGLSAGQTFNSLDEFLHAIYPDDRAAMKSAMNSAADAGTDYAFDFRVQWPDGSLHWIAASGRVLGHDQERAARMVGVVMDTTQRVRMEQEANRRLAQLAHVARLTTMGELVSELAHELNQPLYAIANFSEACLNLAHSSGVAQPGDLVAWLEQISEQSNRAGEIMRRVYGFVRRSPVQAKAADTSALVHDCMRLLQVNLRHQDVALHIEPGEDLPPVFVDAVQIQQVLVNLITNAIESMVHLPRTERRIVICSRLNESREVEVSVCDRGRGAADENDENLEGNLERLFEPFFTTKLEGMGMGLSISRSIIEAHGGRLWAERNPDRGLTFRFTLPLVDKET